MRILLVHSSDDQYGSDRLVLLLARGLADRGDEVAVLLPDDTPPGWLSRQLDERSLPWRKGPLAPARRRYLNVRQLPRFLIDLTRARRFIRHEAARTRAEIIHINTSALVVGSILGHPGGARLIWHVHEIIEHPSPFAWAFRLLPLVGADRVIAISEAVQRNLARAGRGARKVQTIYDGIQPRSFPDVPRRSESAGRPLVAYVGRLNRWKGYEVFVDAAALLATDLPVDFVVAGDPPPGEEWRAAALKRRVDALSLSTRVALPGRVVDPGSIYRAADVVVVPSVWPEPFGLVIVEAMQAGCAVVATSHGAAPEIIEDGVTGLLVPPSDAPAIATAVRQLLENPSARQGMGKAARQRVRAQFGADRFVDGIRDAYREILQ